ncbi:PKD domain-containing protein [Nanoarchaeota archaeon]
MAAPGGPYVFAEGSLVSFNGNAYGGSMPYQFRWDIDADGNYDTSWSPFGSATATWNDEYSGYATLQVNDSLGNATTENAIVTIYNVAPTAEAYGPYICTVGDIVDLNGFAIDPGNDVLSYSWDLNNDGIYEIAGQNATFPCTAYGTHAVNISVSDGDGGIGKDSTYVTVNIDPLSVDAQGPYSAPENSTILFNGSAAGGFGTYMYRWDLNGDGVYDTPWSSTADVSILWDDDYNSAIVLQVNDSLGNTATDATNVDVSNVAPTADAHGSYSCTLGDDITLSATATDPGNDVLSYSWDLDNDFVYETTGQSVIVTCTTNGTQPINLRVEDDDHGVGLDATYISVGIPSLFAYANGPYSGSEGIEISFTGSAAGGLSPYQYRWDFNNDGIWDTLWASTADADATYSDDYSGSAILEVMDDAGNLALSSAVVTVSNLPPVAEANGPYFCNEGQIITLTGNATDNGAADTFTYEWDLDRDGTYETAGQNVVYTCGPIDIYEINLKVTDDDNAFATDVAIVNVGTFADVFAPSITIISPQTTSYNTTSVLVNISATDLSGIDKVWYTINNGQGIEYIAPVNLVLSDNLVYTLTVYANDTEGNLGSESVVFTINTTTPEIEPESDKPKYRAKIEKIRMNNGGFINVGDDLKTRISLSNTGEEDIEDARISVVIPDLGIWKKISHINLDEGDKTTKEVVLDMPDDVEPGEYMARIVVSNGKTKRVVHRLIIIE